MREENKRKYWVGQPIKSTDRWGASFNDGYAPLTQYIDLIHSSPYSLENEKFGDYVRGSKQIAHDWDDGVTESYRDIGVDYGVWIDEPGTPDGNGIYHNPPYIVDSVHIFGRKAVYSIRPNVSV